MSDAASTSLGEKLEALYGTLPAEEQQILDFLLAQAGDHIAEHGEVQGHTFKRGWPFKWQGGNIEGSGDPTADLAASETGGLATPGVINWLVASARDANLLS